MPAKDFSFYFDGGAEPDPTAFSLDPEAAAREYAKTKIQDQMLGEVTTASAEGPGMLEGMKAGGAASLPGAAAALYGAYQGNKFLKGKRLDPFSKVALALPTAGLSLFSDKLQDAFGLGPRTTVESDKWAGLLEDPELAKLVGPEAASRLSTDVTEAPIRADLPGGFVGRDPRDNQFVNNAFNITRDEKFLKPEDLLLYQDLVTTIDPKKYFGTTHENRLALAQSALDSGVDEHHGTIDLRNKDAVRAKAKELGLI